MSDLASIVEDRSRSALRVILREKDRLNLTDDEHDRLRRVIVQEVNDLTRLATTLLASLDGQLQGGYALNQLWLEQIGQHLGVDVEASG